MQITYEQLTARNWGYISADLQNTISKSRVLIAGCGIGSQVAQAAVRIGFQNFILLDGDIVDVHNLNRQFFFVDQIGKYKADSLKDNLLKINPSAHVEAGTELLTSQNAPIYVDKSDIVVDTIDFLDLPAVVALHDEAHRQNKTVISSFSAGFGAAVICFPPSNRPNSLIREIFDLNKTGDIGKVSYVERFQKLFISLAPGLDPQVLEVMGKVFQEMADGRTCPAPQISVGAEMVAALCVSACLRLLENKKMTLGPQMIVVNLMDALQGRGIQLVSP